MNIAVLSGKGGTGKTTVSTNLAVMMEANYIDCDVEEPNGFIFLNPVIANKEDVKVIYPVIDNEKCTLCGECVSACQFNALAKTPKEIVVFEKLCHGCGACEIACKYGAMSYKERVIGIVETGEVDKIICKRGLLNIGEPMAVPVIRKLFNDIDEGVNIIDCPPGTSCNVVNTVQQAEGAILVTEPTEFGLHDLNLAVELLKKFKIPFGVVINKNIGDKNIITDYCNSQSIPVFGKIPYDREIAKLYSNGKLIVKEPQYNVIFKEIIAEMKEVFTWS